jgi:hypothetical protein
MKNIFSIKKRATQKDQNETVMISKHITTAIIPRKRKYVIPNYINAKHIIFLMTDLFGLLSLPRNNDIDREIKGKNSRKEYLAYVADSE